VDRVQAENSVLASVRGWWDAPDVGPVLRAVAGRAAGRGGAGVGRVREVLRPVRRLQEGLRQGVQGNAAQARPSGLPKLDVKAIAGKAVEKAAGVARRRSRGSTRTERHDQGAAPGVPRRGPRNIDYDAKTTGENRQGQFVNSEYEAKPPLWKMGFRAGREATEAARGFAKEWLRRAAE